MPDFEVTSPSGQKFMVTAPEGASQDDILGYAQKQLNDKKESFLSAFTGGAVKGLLSGGSASEPRTSTESEEDYQARSPTGQAQHLEQQFPTPESLKGRLIQGIAEGTFNPTNLLGPARAVPLIGRLVTGGLSGAGAELAGAVSKDNPAAKLAGGLAGGLLPRATVAAGGRVAGAIAPRPDALPRSVPPERAGPVGTLRAAGVEPTAGDVLGRNFVRQLERQGDRLLGGDSYHRLKTEVGETYTRAVSRSIGEDARRLTPDVIQNVRTRLGRVFDRVATALPINADKQLGPELTKIEQDIFTYGHSDEVYRRINALIQHINKGFITKLRRGKEIGEMDGATYQGITRHGESLQQAIDDTNTNIGYFAGRIRTALDDAMTRTVDNAVKNAFSRGQPGGPAQARAMKLAQAQHELREARRQWYNMIVISKSLSGSGESTAQHLILPERLRANLTSGADNKLSYAAERSDLGQLANAGAAVIETQKPPGWYEHTASQIAAAGLSLLAGGPKTAAAVMTVPGLTGRVINSTAAQNMLKNQRAYRLLDQLSGVREILARSAVISQTTGRQPQSGQQQSGIVPTSALLGRRPGDQGGEGAGPFDPVHLAVTKPRDYLRELHRNPEILEKNIDQASSFSFGGMAGRPRLAADVYAGIVKLLKAGLTRAQVAMKLGISESALGQRIARGGIAGNAPIGRPTQAYKAGSTPDSESLQKIVRLRNQGVKNEQIAYELGISMEELQSWIRQGGLRGPKGRPSKPLPRYTDLPDGTFDQRLKKVLTEKPELRQVPFGMSNEEVQAMSYEDYIKMLNQGSKLPTRYGGTDAD